ncbi:MAG TPA: NAD-dependent epimerase/dehydratase family protein [Gaiellaceae bacterium]|nr:NAD-dependent epimerase/dehydratase family protein [Gaiellaceae bacterium]
MIVAVTGARGHVGGRLADELERRGEDVRRLTREDGDVADRAAMLAALDGVDAAYYLVHSLASAGEFAEEERGGAREFAAAARERGVGRLVYLGGIVHDEALSPHLQSRREVGEILRSSGVPTIELRASIVVGAGSASFELVKTIVTWLPSPVAPDWLDHLAQPIAVDDVVAYLVAALAVPLEGEAVYEIGGAETVRYRDLVNEVAEQLGRSTREVTVPVPDMPALPTALASLLPERLRLPLHLLESLQYDTDVRDRSAERDFDVRPRGLREAVTAALA